MHSKHFQKQSKLIEKNKTYPLAEAVELMKKTATKKFDSSVEIHLRLGIDPKQSDQLVRGSIILPHGTGQTKRIAVFTTPAHQAEAEKAGAEVIGGEELVAKVKETGKCDFDLALSTPDFMKNLASIAKVLGPKGLMPTLKNNTITNDLAKAIEELKKGKVTYKNDDTSNLHAVVGKASWENEKLIANIKSLLESITKSKPAGSKGIFIRNIVLSSTMGPGIKISV